MRIAVMGAGSIGGFFGAKLALAGNEVTFIARGANKEAMRQRGLRVVVDAGEFTARCRVTDDPAQVGPVDLAMLTVKTYHNAQAVPAMRPLVGPDTVILCLQNGIDSYQAPAREFGAARVLPGAAYVEAGHPEPGVFTQTGDVTRIVFGETDGSAQGRDEYLLRTLRQAGIDAEFSRDVQKVLWTKFLFIATMAGVTSLARARLAELLPRPEWRRVAQACLEEIERVGRASGVNLEPDVTARTLAYMDSSLEHLSASMHADLLAGRPLELEALNGAVTRAGRAVNQPTPINDLIYAMLKPYANGARRE